MTYEETIEDIIHRRRFGKASGCQVTGEMMERLGHPESGMRIIHIAGTNGKGSTAAFVSSILQAAGFCVGLFTSPHLLEFTERIQVNGAQIPRETVVRLGEVLRSVPMELECTMFDLALAMGILYFREQRCDFVVLETGLGGRLDSTNGLAQTPLVAVVTNIGLEHTQILGDTLEEIAGEKAGILKPGSRAVLGKMEPRAREVLTEWCRRRDIPWRDAAEPEWNVAEPEWDAAEPERDTAEPERNAPVRLGLRGGYQRQNAATAVAVFDTLLEVCPKEFCGKDREKILREGLEKAVWPGRMEILSRRPFLLVDGAHNPQGVEALTRSLQEAWPGETFLFVVGILADKDYGRMLETTFPLAKKYYAVTVESSRSLQGRIIEEFLRHRGQEAVPCQNLEDCLRDAMREAGDTGKIVVFGSLYFIAQVKEHLQKQKGETDL